MCIRDSTDIIVTVQVTWSGSPDSPPVSAGQVTGGILSLDNPCLGTRWPCWADYRVEAPRATAVRWTAGSGDLSVTSVASLVGQGGSSDVTVRDVPKVEVTTSSGDVDVCRVSTSLSIRTSSGDVDACEVRTEAATVQTSSGAVSYTHLDVYKRQGSIPPGGFCPGGWKPCSNPLGKG